LDDGWFANPLATAAFTDTSGVAYGRHRYRSPDFFAAGIPGTGTAVGTAGYRYGGRLIGYCRGCLGNGLLAWKRYRLHFGIALAVFFVLVFPGNIAQYINRIDAFSLDTDAKRLVRLFFQPVLVVWALWSSGAWSYLRWRSMPHVNGTERK